MDGKGGAPVIPPSRPIQLDTSGLSESASTSLWDRITTWASENKALIYTIAGVTLVVTAAGVVYYTSESKPSADTSSAASRAKSNKKAKRKAKKEAEEQAKKEGEKAKTGRLDGACRM
jgi:import receptor subunit TOM70